MNLDSFGRDSDTTQVDASHGRFELARRPFDLFGFVVVKGLNGFSHDAGFDLDYRARSIRPFHDQVELIPANSTVAIDERSAAPHEECQRLGLAEAGELSAVGGDHLERRARLQLLDVDVAETQHSYVL